MKNYNQLDHMLLVDVKLQKLIYLIHLKLLVIMLLIIAAIYNKN